MAILCPKQPSQVSRNCRVLQTRREMRVAACPRALERSVVVCYIWWVNKKLIIFNFVFYCLRPLPAHQAQPITKYMKEKNIKDKIKENCIHHCEFCHSLKLCCGSRCPQCRYPILSLPLKSRILVSIGNSNQITGSPYICCRYLHALDTFTICYILNLLGKVVRTPDLVHVENLKYRDFVKVIRVIFTRALFFLVERKVQS